MLINLKNATVALGDHTLLENVNMQVSEGEFVYIIGEVGSGKSSLLKTLYGELPAQGDEAEVMGHNLLNLRPSQLPKLRRKLGIVFQDFQLLTELTVKENLDFVLRSTGWRKRTERDGRIAEVLSTVGLEEKHDHYPHQLSGGEQQRAAIARALLSHPALILADEPTGNLDAETGDAITALLRGTAERGAAVVMVTHNLGLLEKYPGIVYHCHEGALTHETKAERE